MPGECLKPEACSRHVRWHTQFGYVSSVLKPGLANSEGVQMCRKCRNFELSFAWEMSDQEVDDGISYSCQSKNYRITIPLPSNKMANSKSSASRNDVPKSSYKTVLPALKAYIGIWWKRREHTFIGSNANYYGQRQIEEHNSKKAPQSAKQYQKFCNSLKAKMGFC
jgi:hypothetical protein